MSTLDIPEFCLVAILGPVCVGKRAFAAAHFTADEIVSSSRRRALERAPADTVTWLQDTVDARLAARILTAVVVDEPVEQVRNALIRIAKAHSAQLRWIAFDVTMSDCLDAASIDPDEGTLAARMRRQRAALQKSLTRLGESRHHKRMIVLDSRAAVEGLKVTRHRLITDHRDLHGPFDIVGDVHGCLDELLELLDELGYDVQSRADGAWELDAPPATGVESARRRLVFVGDLIDRGPSPVACLRLAMDAVDAGVALMVPGNHEAKLRRALGGSKVKMSHGFESTWREIQAASPGFRARTERFLSELPPHLVLDDGRLVIAHAGLEEALHNRVGGRSISFALFGKTTGKTDTLGFPIRLDWAKDYRGEATVVYGHTPSMRAKWVNNTICIDTGCVFGNRLTSLRYPERELVQVEAHETYVDRGLTALSNSRG